MNEDTYDIKNKITFIQDYDDYDFIKEYYDTLNDNSIYKCNDSSKSVNTKKPEIKEVNANNIHKHLTLQYKTLEKDSISINSIKYSNQYDKDANQNNFSSIKHSKDENTNSNDNLKKVYKDVLEIKKKKKDDLTNLYFKQNSTKNKTELDKVIKSDSINSDLNNISKETESVKVIKSDSINLDSDNISKETESVKLIKSDSINSDSDNNSKLNINKFSNKNNDKEVIKIKESKNTNKYDLKNNSKTILQNKKLENINKNDIKNINETVYKFKQSKNATNINSKKVNLLKIKSLSDNEEISTDNEFVKINKLYGLKALSKVKHNETVDIKNKATSRNKLKINKHYINEINSSVYDLVEAENLNKVLDKNIDQQSDNVSVSELNFKPETIIDEVKNSIIQHKKYNDDDEVNKFVISTTELAMPAINMMNLNHFLKKDIYDMLQFNDIGNGFVNCWVKIKSDEFMYFDPLKKKLADIDDHDIYFQDPNDKNIFYKIRKQFKFRDAELFLNIKKKPFLFNWCCESFFDNLNTTLLNITNFKIKNIINKNHGYRAEFINDLNKTEYIDLCNFDLIFKVERNHIFLKAKSIDSFLKWILIFHLRKKYFSELEDQENI